MQRLADEGIVEASLLDRARRQHSNDRLVRLVAAIKAAAPNSTLQLIAFKWRLGANVCCGGGSRWHPPCVEHLLVQAERFGHAEKLMAFVGKAAWH